MNTMAKWEINQQNYDSFESKTNQYHQQYHDIHNSYFLYYTHYKQTLPGDLHDVGMKKAGIPSQYLIYDIVAFENYLLDHIH